MFNFDVEFLDVHHKDYANSVPILHSRIWTFYLTRGGCTFACTLSIMYQT